jgi:hypothetical protein
MSAAAVAADAERPDDCFSAAGRRSRRSGHDNIAIVRGLMGQSHPIPQPARRERQGFTAQRPLPLLLSATFRHATRQSAIGSSATLAASALVNAAAAADLFAVDDAALGQVVRGHLARTLSPTIDLMRYLRILPAV